MSTTAQRRKKLRVGGIWHDSQDNKVEIKAIRNGKVYFEILELPDHQPKNMPNGTVRIMPMEDRIECLPVDTFIAQATGFDCMMERSTVRKKNF